MLTELHAGHRTAPMLEPELTFREGTWLTFPVFGPFHFRSTPRSAKTKCGNNVQTEGTFRETHAVKWWDCITKSAPTVD